MIYVIQQKHKWLRVGTVVKEFISDVIDPRAFDEDFELGYRSVLLDHLGMIKSMIKRRRNVDVNNMIVGVSNSPMWREKSSMDRYRITFPVACEDGKPAVCSDNLSWMNGENSSRFVYIMPHIPTMDRHLKNSFKESMGRINKNKDKALLKLRLIRLDEGVVEISPCISCKNMVACVSDGIKGLDGDFPIKLCVGYSENTFQVEKNVSVGAHVNILDGDDSIIEQLNIDSFIKG